MATLNPKSLQTKRGINFTLRSPNPGEGAALLKVVREIMRQSEHLLTQEDEFRYTPAQEEEMFRAYAEHPAKLIIVPVLAGRIIGMLDFSVGAKRRNSHTGELGMSILPEFQGQGIGAAMLTSLLEWARANPSVERVSLRVHGRNAKARRLYEKLGFMEEGRELRGVKLEGGEYDDVLSLVTFTDR